MENLSNKISNAVNELKDTIKSAVAEIKKNITADLGVLASVKQNLSNSYSELETIFCVADDLSIEMEMLAEDMDKSLDDLGGVLEIINPEEFGEDEEEDFKDCLEIEDEDGNMYHSSTSEIQLESRMGKGKILTGIGIIKSKWVYSFRLKGQK